MKILPLYKLIAQKDDWAWFFEARFPKRSMVLVLSGNMEFPAGTPKEWNGVVIYRGEINHYHDVTGWGDLQPAGWDPNGYAIAVAKRLGSARQKLRRFLEEFPPVDFNVQRWRLRQLVREGD